MSGITPDTLVAAGGGVPGALAVLVFAVGFGLLGAFACAVLGRRTGSRGRDGTGQDGPCSAAASSPAPG